MKNYFISFFRNIKMLWKVIFTMALIFNIVSSPWLFLHTDNVIGAIQEKREYTEGGEAVNDILVVSTNHDVHYRDKGSYFIVNYDDMTIKSNIHSLGINNVINIDFSGRNVLKMIWIDIFTKLILSPLISILVVSCFLSVYTGIAHVDQLSMIDRVKLTHKNERNVLMIIEFVLIFISLVLEFYALHGNGDLQMTTVLISIALVIAMGCTFTIDLHYIILRKNEISYEVYSKEEKKNVTKN